MRFLHILTICFHLRQAIRDERGRLVERKEVRAEVKAGLFMHKTAFGNVELDERAFVTIETRRYMNG